MDGLRQALLDLITSALLGFDNMITSAETVLTNGLGSTWNAVLELSEILKPFCLTIIGICLLIEIAQVAAKVDIIKWEHGLKLAVKMVLSKVCIDIAPTFLEACYRQAALWISLATGASIGGVSTLGSLVNDQMETLVMSVDGLWGVLGLFISVLVVVIAIKICGLMVQVIAYGRMFELLVYLAVSPLPCAFLPLGDGSGGGYSRVTGNFFKNFVAICLQGVMMILCLRLFGILMTTAITDGIAQAAGLEGTVAVSELCYSMLMGAIVLVMSVVKSGSWAKSIINAM